MGKSLEWRVVMDDDGLWSGVFHGHHQPASQIRDESATAQNQPENEDQANEGQWQSEGLRQACSHASDHFALVASVPLCGSEGFAHDDFLFPSGGPPLLEPAPCMRAIRTRAAVISVSPALLAVLRLFLSPRLLRKLSVAILTLSGTIYKRRQPCATLTSFVGVPGYMEMVRCRRSISW